MRDSESVSGLHLRRSNATGRLHTTAIAASIKLSLPVAHKVFSTAAVFDQTTYFSTMKDTNDNDDDVDQACRKHNKSQLNPRFPKPAKLNVNSGSWWRHSDVQAWGQL